jgi:hypothetical protein
VIHDWFVVVVLILCMTVRVSFFHSIPFHSIPFHSIPFIVLEIGDDYLKKKCEQSLSIDSAAAFPAVLPDNGAYNVEPIFHSSVL